MIMRRWASSGSVETLCTSMGACLLMMATPYALLAVEDHVVAHGLHIPSGKASSCTLISCRPIVRLVLVDKGLQLMKTGTQAIDIERDDLHVRGAHVVFVRRLLD
jgi:hypothetical protein